MQKPNIIFICTDQQRSDSLGCAGNKFARSPNIDSIAKAGTRLTRHSTPMQICSPSRATMLTGLYPRNHQLVTNGRALPENIPTLTNMLVKQGYRTHGVGKQHLQPLLAAEEHGMPDSRAFWQTPAAKNWNGPYYGYQTIDLLLGESDTAHLAGHYANWLKANYPESVNLLDPESSDIEPPKDLDEIWHPAIPYEHHYSSWITERSVDFINQQNNEDPFFLFISYPDPHHPFDPPAPYPGRFDANDMELPQVDECELTTRPGYCDELYPKGEGFRELYWAGRMDMEAGSMITTENISDDSMRTAIAYTYAMIEMIDDGIGKILDAAKAKELMDNTYIVFTSDHGEYLGDHGLLHKGPASYRQLTEVAMMIQGPAIPASQEINSLTNHIDLTPTLLDLVGVNANGTKFDGESIKQVLTGDKEKVRDYCFGEYHPTARAELYNQTVRTQKWRYTNYPAHPEWGELFDLDNDPHERKNVFGKGENADVKQELAQVLEEKFPPAADAGCEVLCKW